MAIFFFVQIFGVFFIVKPAYAQMDGAITSAFVSKWTYDKIESNLTAAALGSLVSGVSYFMRKLAYDGAKYIASGGKGQEALAFKDGFGSYLKDTGGAALGSAIENLGKPFGLNLCSPPDIRVKASLQVGLDKIYNAANKTDGTAPAPDCTWTEFKNNWQDIGELYNKDSISERFAVSVKSTQSDLGITLNSMSKLDKLLTTKQQAAILDRQEGNGFKSVGDLIAGNIKTPASLVQYEATNLTAKEQAKFSSEQVAGLYGASAWQIIPTSLSIFANTLVSSLLDRVLNKGIINNQTGDALNVDAMAYSVSSNRQAAEKAFSFLITGIPQRNLNSYDVVTRFTACPETPGLDNCIMDSDLGSALGREYSDTPLTIKQAIDIGLLHGDYKLIPPSNIVDNTDTDCYLGAYCYSNIQKMRKARILPLGFEIAASKSNPDSPYTLAEVVAGYNQCNTTLTPDAQNPFCHLIDPNWVLRVPEARCEAQVYGPLLSSDNSNQRISECADFSSCIAYDNNGQCINFGYCTKEKNAWDIPGVSCPSEYNTCKTYASTNGNIASYLSRTVDYGTCNIDSVGCTAYSADKLNGNWKNDNTVDLALQKAGREQVLYFNDNINNLKCPASENGCSLFIYPATNQDVYLKKAPDYLGCYDMDLTTTEIEWAKSIADLNTLKSRSQVECADFAPVCIQDEVGCEAYTPKDGGVTLTGVVGNNFCPSQCVGYDTFKQEETKFEKAEFPLYLRPADGQSCAPQYAGCDEFTNLSTVSGENLEYYSDLKYCQPKDGNDAKLYYAWVGSDSQGYVLKQYTLAPVDQAESNFIDSLAPLGLLADASLDSQIEGSPRYADTSVDTLNSNYEICNAESYDILIHNPYAPGAASTDCREFHDADANIYYRLLKETITVSDSCQPLRKTNSDSYKSRELTAKGQSVCENRNGKWENSSCMVCMNGGEYSTDNKGVGYCKYWSIPEEAQSCPAVVNGCRLYIGNTGNNLHEIYSTSFEPSGDGATALVDARRGWGAGESDNTISVEPEATQLGLYSLKIKNGSTYLNLGSKLQKGNWYQVSFWARGDNSKVNIFFGQNNSAALGSFTTDPLNGNAIPVTVGYDWQEYNLGPVMYEGENSSVNSILTFTSGATGEYFVDNVRVVSMSDSPNDYVPLVKDSWKTSEGYDVSTSCDSTPTDAYPGEYLGCKEYGTRDNQTVNITGFQNLCRAEAVGCTGLVDTNNIRPDTYVGVKDVAYNLRCVQGYNNTSDICKVTILDQEYSCSVVKGERNCHIEVPIPFDNDSSIGNFVASADVLPLDRAYFDASTVVVPISESNTLNNLVYLTVNSNSLCTQQYLGCQKVAVQTQVLPDTTKAASYDFSETYVLNNPNNYANTLCTQEQKSCKSFTNGNNVSFFKDPATSRGALCVYKSATQVSGSNASGWFLDGVGKCSSGVDYCRQDSDCGTGNICQNIGNQPCYNNYLLTSGEYGVYSNGSESYDGLVASCEPNYNGCTELVDPIDEKSYYVVNDEKLYAKASECNGKVSERDGCVLFDMTENPSKFYDSAVTYNSSKNKDYQLVEIETVDATVGDSNTLLKVDRNRQCGEWLACRTSKVEVDENGVAQKLCLDYQACNKLGANGDCASDGWVLDKSNALLTEKKYISRKDFSDYDYSGYSLFNKYNPSDYVYLQFPNHTDAYLAYQVSDSLFVGDYRNNGCFGLKPDGTLAKNDGDVCGADSGGRCYSQKCLYPTNGKYNSSVEVVANNNKETISRNVEKMLSFLEPGTCKSFPEIDSPYDTSLAISGNPADSNNTNIKKNDNLLNGPVRFEYQSIKNDFAKANICQFDAEGKEDCSCDYIKVEYKNGTKDYWPRNANLDIPIGICSGTGDKDGEPCEKDSDCSIGGTNNYGTCNQQKSNNTYIGLKGLCLEYDLSRPVGTVEKNNNIYQQFACLTWLPIQVSATAYDLYNSDVQAGYYPERGYDSEYGGLAYCAESTNYDLGYYDDETFGKMLFKYDLLGPNGNTREEKTVNQIDCDPRIQEDCQGYQACGDGAYDANGDIIWCNEGATNLNGFDNLYLDTGATKHWFNDMFLLNEKVYTGMNNGDVYPLYKKEWGRNDCTNNYEDAFIMKFLRSTEGFYKGMQAWAWLDIGPNSRILRFDADGNCFKNQGYDNVFGFDKASSGDDTAVVYSFAPLLFSSNNAVNDSGTIMHPPFPSGLSYDAVSSANDDPNYVMTVNSTNYVNAESTAFSSRQSLKLLNSSKDGENKLYIDLDVESKLSENDLSSVYFVPVSYPDGAEGPDPGILTKNFYINFTYLKNSGKDFGMVNVPSIKDDKFLSVTDKYSGSTKNFFYKLTRKNDEFNCQDNGLLSKCNYENGNVTEESKIYTRYVALYYNSSLFGLGHKFDFDTTEHLPNNIDNDPFSADCVGKSDNNWLAIGMDFNEDGEFLGYISRYCNGTGGDTGIRFVTIADLNNRCTQLVSVVNDKSKWYSYEGYNKAWTNRVWAGAKDLPSFIQVNLAADKSTNLAPFGSLNLKDNDIRSMVDGNYQVDLSKNVRYYGFSDNNIGIPYSATGASLFDKEYRANQVGDTSITTVQSSDNHIFTTNSYFDDPISNNKRLSAARTIHGLFVKYYSFWDLFKDSKLSDSDDLKLDVSDSSFGLKPPQIYSINYTTCQNNSLSDNCVASTNGMTVNDRNYNITNVSTDIRSNEDKNGDNVIDPIIAKGSYTADMRFFGFADDNRMPIKRVMVKWGDNIITGQGSVGFYKNRKPYCAPDGDVGRCSLNSTWSEGDSQLTCRVDEDCKGLGENYKCDIDGVAVQGNFGDDERACKSDYFEFTHNYYCDVENSNDAYTLDEIKNNALVKSIIGNGEGTGNSYFEVRLFGPSSDSKSVANAQAAYAALKSLGEENLQDDDKVCVFKPAVQVLDNWGWCNGSCNNNDGNGCYNEYQQSAQSFVSDQCKSSSFKDWDYYKGSIVIIP
ncbi:MAG: hypothetical protein COX80_03995 [Candidatus Magasanikbacteria bacterium CG_4_10_14_0_2_um_filter_33_14]|uniref:Uncharacterized protein n=1 Tax=Candidatus Magasanikbacteria bacterium CG_4_10_14_0_2_um_filter_33_14 TaxID=1974636 RepID=A0A2M7V9V2_9BACT|nr:MAG: hypothetical protein COX80_03995 [Candidatus Magasanikbacteria bacterium CG_4_10_14_0_2_um_filter_33_14]